jgi:single-stranded-DNA-specific exonuclease
MQAEALTLCQQLERSGDTLPGGLAMYHPQWHQGWSGFWRRGLKSASIARLSPLPQPATGAKRLRALYPGLHMRDALERLDTLHPGLILKFGGHAMAAGLSLEEARFEEFQQLLASWSPNGWIRRCCRGSGL